MPINFQQIQSAIQRFAQQAPAQAKLREEQLAMALSLLQLYAEDGGALQQKIQVASAANPDLRCALPTQEIGRAHV